MMSTKKDVHAELITRYKEYFESTLAVSLLNQAALFPAVKKVSNCMLRTINKFPQEMVRIIANDEKISHELYDQSFFGRIDTYAKSSFPSAEITLQKIIEILTKSESLDKIMQVHAVFIYRIAKPLRQREAKKVPIINLNERGRKEQMHTVTLSKQLGITKNKVFTKLIKHETYEHIRGCDRFLPDCQSRFFKTISAKHIPFAAGLSNHTATFMAGAMQLGLAKNEELKQYLLACFVFLAAGGNHSFHEVMSIGKQIGINYEDGNYLKCLPATFRTTKLFQQLKKSFPDLLADENVELDVSDEEMLASSFGRSASSRIVLTY